MLQDRELQVFVERARHGDTEAEHRVFEYLRVRFIILAQKRISRDMAEDIAHEACITVFEKFHNTPSDVEFLAWAYKILRNKIGSHMRSSKYKKSIEYSSEGIEEIIGRKSTEENFEFRLILKGCLRKMADQYPNYIRILNLSNQGYTSVEICEKLGIKPNYMYVMLHRCRGWLFNCIFGNETKNE
ncbi:MAG: RNA polymerase sigma factor [Candidatus Zixiibacteriota bacterium]